MFKLLKLGFNVAIQHFINQTELFKLQLHNHANFVFRYQIKMFLNDMAVHLYLLYPTSVF